MKEHPRLRKAAKWGGLGLARVCVALWCVSAPWTVDYGALNDRGAMLGFGTIWFTFNDSPPDPLPTPAAVGRLPRFFRRDVFQTPALGGGMLWTYQRLVTIASGPTGTRSWEIAIIPLWMPAGFGLAMGVPAWALDRRARRAALAGHCPKCRYDRSGIPAAAACPECGAAGR